MSPATLPLIDHVYEITPPGHTSPEQVLVVQANHVVIRYIVRDMMGRFPISEPINFGRTLPTVTWNNGNPQVLRRSKEEDLV